MPYGNRVRDAGIYMQHERSKRNSFEESFLAQILSVGTVKKNQPHLGF